MTTPLKYKLENGKILVNGTEDGYWFTSYHDRASVDELEMYKRDWPELYPLMRKKFGLDDETTNA